MKIGKVSSRKSNAYKIERPLVFKTSGRLWLGEQLLARDMRVFRLDGPHHEKHLVLMLQSGMFLTDLFQNPRPRVVSLEQCFDPIPGRHGHVSLGWMPLTNL